MYRKYLKRLLDAIISLTLLPVFLPLIGICALIIKLEDGGPVFYYGSRLGKNGRNFKMFKLRSMRVDSPDIRNADGSTFNGDNDPRLTRIGGLLRKTSIDELPQLFNVLLGDMSFIGPRPDLPEQLTRYSSFERRKLDVRPGISGYSQAYYRNSISSAQKFENDVFYVNNISIALDIKILFITIANVFQRKNIHVVSSDNLDVVNSKKSI